jgi:hypothetical protein
MRADIFIALRLVLLHTAALQKKPPRFLRAALNFYRSGVCENADLFLTALSQARLRGYFFFAGLAASSSSAA